MKKNEKGFGAVEVLLILVIVALVSVVGYTVYQNRSKRNSVMTSTSAIQESKNSLGLTSTDKIGIVAGVLKFCQQSADGEYVVQGIENLDNAQFTRTKENFVMAGLFCYNKSLPRDTQGSGQDFLLKKSGSVWTAISADQMAPACIKLDGYGIPAGFLQCIGSDNQPRDPK